MAQVHDNVMARMNATFDAFQKRMQSWRAQDEEINVRERSIFKRPREPETVEIKPEFEDGDFSDQDFDASGQPVYVVERINGMRETRRNGRQFRVVWKGYSAREASWLCEAELDNCQGAVYRYLAERRPKRRRVA